MNAKSILIVVLLVLFISGCSSTYFYREGTSFDDCKKDNEECGYEAEIEYPNYWILDQGIKQYEYRKKCMELRGYKLIKRKNLPQSVKRVELYMGRVRDGGCSGE